MMWRSGWFDEYYETREEAIITALTDLEVGETLIAHQGDCRLGRRGWRWLPPRLACDCQPDRWTHEGDDHGEGAE